MENQYKEAVADAMEAVKSIEDPELKKTGFEIILKQLINGAVTETFPHQIASVGNDSVGDVAMLSYPNKTGLTEEEISTLFLINGETITLKVKPSGSSVAEKQQALAHTLLIGYKATLGLDNIPSMVVAAVAREWNLWDKNISKNIQAAGYIQAKGVKKAVIYSLKPGAIDKLRESVQKMARGE